MQKFFHIFIILVFWGLIFTGCFNSNIELGYTLPHLPYPIAKEKALITIAGQGPEGLIVAKMCDELKIENTFRYKATVKDLEEKRSLIVVVSVSKIGLKSVDTNYELEKERIHKLIRKANEQRIPVIMLFIGGNNRWDKLNQEMIMLVAKYTNYMIAVSNNESKDFFRTQAAKNNIEFYTLVKDLERVKIPLNSAFR